MSSVWDKRKAVQRMQEYIETRLKCPITLTELAKAGHYSAFHAARIFKEITGRSPFEYIRMRRLSAAAERLLEKKSRVIDVAFDFVFDSHEGFTRAFSKQFGLPPSRMRKSESIDLFDPVMVASEFYVKRQKGELSVKESEKNEKTSVVFVQILERPFRKLIFKPAIHARHYFEYCEEAGCDVWQILEKIPETLHEPMGLWMPDNLRPANTSSYVQGVEVPEGFKGEIPHGFNVIELPPCKMLVFQGEPFDEKDFEKAIGNLWDVMAKYDPETIGYQWADEYAPRFQLAPLGYRGYIEGRPVRKIS